MGFCDTIFCNESFLEQIFISGHTQHEIHIMECEAWNKIWNLKEGSFDGWGQPIIDKLHMYFILRYRRLM